MQQQPVYLFVKWQVKEGSLPQVLGLLPPLIEKSRQEEGNLIYQVHQSTTDEHTLLLYEGYRDEAALAAHRESAHFNEWVLNGIVPLLQHREVVMAKELPDESQVEE